MVSGETPDPLANLLSRMERNSELTNKLRKLRQMMDLAEAQRDQAAIDQT